MGTGTEFDDYGQPDWVGYEEWLDELSPYEGDMEYLNWIFGIYDEEEDDA